MKIIKVHYHDFSYYVRLVRVFKLKPTNSHVVMFLILHFEFGQALFVDLSWLTHYLYSPFIIVEKRSRNTTQLWTQSYRLRLVD